MYDSTKPYKQKIIELTKTTWPTPYLSCKNGIVIKKFSFPEYHHSDGIGSKGIYHFEKRSFKNAVIDSLAMNLNDLAMIGAEPYALIDHIMIPKDDHRAILEIVRNLSYKAREYHIAITGGETAVHSDGEGLEISITMLGFVKTLRTNQIRKDDLIIGLESNGLHANGFTKVREIFKKEFRQDFIRPTNIYLNTILKLVKKYNISGMMHITGGAFTKIKDISAGCNVIINQRELRPQKIFDEIYNRGVSDSEMYKIFNCGIGYILAVKKNEAQKCLLDIKDFKARIIGEAVDGSGQIIIHSKFSDNVVKY